MVLGRCTDILAWNPLAAALFTDFAALPREQRNFVRRARDPRDPRLMMLVGELSVQDQDFRRWWGDHRVAERTGGTKTLRHPIAGELALDWSTLTDAADPDQQLIALTAAPGMLAHDGLRLLASWAAEPAPARPSTAGNSVHHPRTP